MNSTGSTFYILVESTPIAVYFDVKFFKENIFIIYYVCFAIKLLIKSKIFSVKRKTNGKNCKIFYT